MDVKATFPASVGLSLNSGRPGTTDVGYVQMRRGALMRKFSKSNLWLSIDGEARGRVSILRC